MTNIRMKALMAFSHVIQGQVYHGDPEHPDVENGRKFWAKEEHEEELTRLKLAKKVKMKEVEEDDDTSTSAKLPTEISGDNALRNPGGDGFDLNGLSRDALIAGNGAGQPVQNVISTQDGSPTPAELEKTKAAEAKSSAATGGGEGRSGAGEGDGEFTLPADNQTLRLSDGENEIVILANGGGWYTVTAVGADGGEDVVEKLRKKDLESNLAKAKAGGTELTVVPADAPPR